MALTVEKKVRGTEKRPRARGRGLLLGTRPSEDFPNLTHMSTASFQGRRSQGGSDLQLRQKAKQQSGKQEQEHVMALG